MSKSKVSIYFSSNRIGKFLQITFLYGVRRYAKASSEDVCQVWKQQSEQLQ